MKAKNVLFIHSEMMPYTAETEMSIRCRNLPQMIQDLGHEVRTFVPKWGTINDRRNMLHEVYRLSGMNVIIDKTDHIVILKVASIPTARLQVYFIDNDDLFHNRSTVVNPKNGSQYPNLGEKAAFYIRGVMETVKNLNWTPDIIHCTGWIAALAPLYLKKVFSKEERFSKSKIVYAVTPSEFIKPLGKNFFSSVPFGDVSTEDISDICTTKCTYNDLMKVAMKFADGIIFEDKAENKELASYAKTAGVPVLKAQKSDKYVDAYNDFYETVMAGKKAKSPVSRVQSPETKAKSQELRAKSPKTKTAAKAKSPVSRVQSPETKTKTAAKPKTATKPKTTAKPKTAAKAKTKTTTKKK